MNEIKMTEPIKRAVAWIDEARREQPAKPMASLLAEAAMRFNLGPQDGQFLERFFMDNKSSENVSP